MSALDTADAAPTTQQSEMYTELEKTLLEQLTVWEQLKSNDIAELNPQLKQAGLPAIDLTKLPAESMIGTQTTSQDRDRNLE